jgi:hypothetical protein
MNSSELRKLLQGLLNLPLEKLSSTEIRKFANQTLSLKESLEKVDIIAKVEQLNNSIPLEDRPFYQDALKKCPYKRPSYNSKLSVWNKYLESMQNYHKKIQIQKKDLTKKLEKLQKASFASGLKAIQSMKPSEKHLLSVLASLTIKSNRGVKPLALGKSTPGNQKWLEELKNIQQLGVLENETDSSFFSG